MAAFESGGIKHCFSWLGPNAFGGGDGIVLQCFYFNCQLDLHVLQGNPDGGG